MIARYSLPEMSNVWVPNSRFQFMLDVEVAVALSQAKLKMIPQKAAKAIESKAKFQVERINEIEKTTRHDVIAFVSSVAENVGEYGRFVHYGLTSSDVLDTAFSLQNRAAVKVLRSEIQKLKKVLLGLSKKHRGTLCAGRTHGMFAEPTTFGYKLAGFLMELERNEERIVQASQRMSICKLSGAVGTYSAQNPLVEKEVARKLKLEIEPIATQVIPRDRHAEMISSLALLMAGYERLAIELRHLQRSEVGEVVEGFSVGQKGSSAMPHKKNPISAENITGLSRLVRGYAITAQENVALWHERDISHSSAERVIFPDAYIVAHYATRRMCDLLEGLFVDSEKMQKNIELSRGMLLSSHLLLALVDKGVLREEAYKWVQECSHSLGENEHLTSKAMAHKEVSRYLTKKEITKVMAGDGIKKSIEKNLSHALGKIKILKESEL